MTAIMKRDFRSYFNSMTGYIYVACIVLVTGIYFMAYNLVYGHPYFAMVVNAIPLIYSVGIPILTMKSFAEERRTKTDQMLLTYPVPVGQIVLGKFFAVMGVVLIPILISCICPIIISLCGTGHPGTDYASLLAFYILCGMYVSIGLFVSSLTENQIISAVISFVALMILYLWDSLVDYIPTKPVANFVGVIIIAIIITLIVYSLSKNRLLTLIVAVVLVGADVIAYLIKPILFFGFLKELFGTFSCVSVLTNFTTYSVFDIGGLFLFLSITAMFLFLTCQVIQKRRWN